MFPNWSIQNEIQKRVQRESNFDWAKTENSPLPKNQPITIIKNNVGYYNLIKGVLRSSLNQLRP